MRRIRRTPYAFFYLQDHWLLDLPSLIRGELPEPAADARISALAILTGRRNEIERDELHFLASVPAERWISEEGLDRHLVRALTDKGLLLSDADNPGMVNLRERDERLSAGAWNLYAALNHFMTQWTGVDTCDGEDDVAEVAEQGTRALQALIATYGSPPDAFAHPRRGPCLQLPRAERQGAFYDVLKARRTTRHFDPHTPMTLAQLDTVLHHVFGCHGYVHSSEGLMHIRRTSPSGGSLHPIEVYPIVSNVAGVTPGIYQYNVAAHAMTLLVELEPSEARRKATAFMCGQHYFGAAHVSFILTARFYRNQWKYRHHPRAYAALLMDAAHLTQTLYLVSAELGLGAFVTIAMNGADIEEDLQFDGVSEGVLAVAGCGVRGQDDSPLEHEFLPWPPR